jgi:hypothetical protein
MESKGVRGEFAMKNDWQRVQSVIAGDRKALESLVREHLRPTYAVAFALTGSSSESEEIVVPGAIWKGSGELTSPPQPRQPILAPPSA